MKTSIMNYNLNLSQFQILYWMEVIQEYPERKKLYKAKLIELGFIKLIDGTLRITKLGSKKLADSMKIFNMAGSKAIEEAKIPTPRLAPWEKEDQNSVYNRTFNTAGVEAIADSATEKE